MTLPWDSLFDKDGNGEHLHLRRAEPDREPSAFLNVAELQVDVGEFEALQQIAKPLEEIATVLTDTTILSGSEAYTAALSYYNSVKQGVKVIFEVT